MDGFPNLEGIVSTMVGCDIYDNRNPSARCVVAHKGASCKFTWIKYFWAIEVFRAKYPIYLEVPHAPLESLPRRLHRCHISPHSRSTELPSPLYLSAIGTLVKTSFRLLTHSKFDHHQSFGVCQNPSAT